MNRTIEDISSPLKKLVVGDFYQSAIHALSKAISLAPSDSASLLSLNEAFGFLDRLPRSLRRLAWFTTLRGPVHVRTVKLKLTEKLWRTGVNYGAVLDGVRIAEALPEPSGVARLLSIAAFSSAKDLSRVVSKIQESEGFLVLCSDAADATIAIDALHIFMNRPVRAQLEAISCELANDPRCAEYVVCKLALWIMSLGNRDQPQIFPPNHTATKYFLEASWARGFRRRAARLLGRHDGIRTHEEYNATPAKTSTLDIPRTLLVDWTQTHDEGPTIRSLLAPLLVEWVACAMERIEPDRNIYLRADAFKRIAPTLGSRLIDAVGAPETPSSQWLRAILNPLRVQNSKF